MHAMRWRVIRIGFSKMHGELISHSFVAGYGRYFRSLRDFLYSQRDLKNRIEIKELKDVTTTGNFGA